MEIARKRQPGACGVRVPNRFAFYWAEALDWRAHCFNAAYNKIVVNAQRQNDSSRHQRHAIYATETTGLLLIAFLLLALTLIRYWHIIHWSVR